MRHPRHVDARSDPGKNIGDLLNAKGVTWGWFQGGFADRRARRRRQRGTTGHAAGVDSADYIPHHEPFQYYRSTPNPHHLPPTSVGEIGHDRPGEPPVRPERLLEAALKAGNLPAVSFLKAAGYQDGHAGYSDPLDEQTFLVNTINTLQKSPFWKDTAVIIAYDDSDGWYDHQMSPIVNQSQDPANDALRGTPTAAPTRTPRWAATRTAAATARACRCSSSRPWRKTNFVDHTMTDQTSILRFIEDNWQTGRIGNYSFDAKAGSLERHVRVRARRPGQDGTAPGRHAPARPEHGAARAEGPRELTRRTRARQHCGPGFPGPALRVDGPSTATAFISRAMDGYPPRRAVDLCVSLGCRRGVAMARGRGRARPSAGRARG